MLAKHINYICQSFARLYKDRQCFRISSKGYCLFCKNTCTVQNFRYDFWPKYRKTVHFPSLCDLPVVFLILSAGADHVYPIIIVYKPVVWLFSCDLRDISIRYLPAAHPIKRWMSCHNHVTYAHSSGIRGRIYEKSALSIPYSPLMDYYFYTFANEERAYSRVRLMVFLHCLHWWIDISTLLQMGNGHVTVYALLFFHRLH